MLSQRELLDMLMGKDRDLPPEKKAEMAAKQLWKDPSVCQYHLCGFCPHEIFTNTKSAIGQCKLNHDDLLRTQFQNEPPQVRYKTELDFLRFLERLCADVDSRINRGKGRLSRTLKPNSDDPEFRKREEQILEIAKSISALLKEMESLGEEGKIDELDALIPKMLAKQAEIAQLEAMNVPQDNLQMRTQEKQMQVCDICGAFLVQNDAEQRITSHLQGKQHTGFIAIRKKIEELKIAHQTAGLSSDSRRSRSSASSFERKPESRERIHDHSRDRDRDRSLERKSRDFDDHRDSRSRSQRKHRRSREYSSSSSSCSRSPSRERRRSRRREDRHRRRSHSRSRSGHRSRRHKDSHSRSHRRSRSR